MSSANAEQTAVPPTLSLAELEQGAGLESLTVACKEWGFFYLTDHGINDTLWQAALAASAEFFAAPAETKNAIRRSEENAWGYYDQELTKNRRDWKEIFDVGPPTKPSEASNAHSAWVPQWPEQPGFRTTIEAISTELHRVSLALVEHIRLTLAHDAPLAQHFDSHTSFLRINHYPPCPDPAPSDSPTEVTHGQLGISHHTDAGAVTALLQDKQPALQVLRNGVWHLVPPKSGTLIINIGDVVQVWSNDLYPAPLHRVLAHTEASRISIPYFLNPNYEYDYAPLPSMCEHRPAKYRAINWGAFRAARSGGDYADIGEEVQIEHYRIGA